MLSGFLMREAYAERPIGANAHKCRASLAGSRRRRSGDTILQMPAASVQETFTRALDTLVEQIKQDRTVLAVILCGSLSHDTVWDKSDIDLVLVTVDDKKREERGIGLYADGINTHASLVTRTGFRQLVEGSFANSFLHSLLAKGRLLYTHDESIAALAERLHVMGDRDR